MSTKTHEAPIPFSSKPVERTTLKTFKGAQISIQSGVAGLTYRVNGKEMPTEAERFEGLVSRTPGGGHLISLRHPDDATKIIGVVLSNPDTRPEVDGVWVADDGGGEYDC